ncbi:MAG: YwiC-like family protein [Elusimicrobiota bacterium]
MLPREHGAWAVLIAPVLLGLFSTGAADIPAAVLFCIGALGAFLTRPALLALLRPAPDPKARAWLAAYAALAAAGFIPLVLVYERTLLLAFAAPAAFLLAADVRAQLARRALSLTNELGGVAALSMGAAAARYAAQGTLDFRAWSLWALSALFFCGPIFYVKMVALAHRACSDPSQGARLERARRLALVYHLAAPLAVFALPLDFPRLSLLPFAAALVKTVLRALRPPEKVNFQSLGYREVAYSALFVAAVLVGYRA